MSIDPQTSNDKGDKNEKNSSKFFFDGLLQRILTEQSQKRLYFKVNQYKNTKYLLPNCINGSVKSITCSLWDVIVKAAKPRSAFFISNLSNLIQL